VRSWLGLGVSGVIAKQRETNWNQPACPVEQTVAGVDEEVEGGGGCEKQAD